MPKSESYSALRRWLFSRTHTFGYATQTTMSPFDEIAIATDFDTNAGRQPNFLAFQDRDRFSNV